ncbi:MAG: hypothetical protein B7Z72_11915 [Gemmatimonadetes bacterium 21-71-4]|nr:MAG: hypothetical protein B7Z72_11915 [Gemmatimonadetes bacterium 21-71-4]
MAVQVKKGTPLRRTPNRKMRAPRRMIWRRSSASSAPRARRAESESSVVMPTMKRKKGKMRSVGV